MTLEVTDWGRDNEICGHSGRTYLLPLDLLCNVSNSAAEFLRDRHSKILFRIDCTVLRSNRREWISGEMSQSLSIRCKVDLKLGCNHFYSQVVVSNL